MLSQSKARMQRALAVRIYPQLSELEAELQIAREAALAANIDPLTGANTRASYEGFVGTEMAKQFHCIVVDLDHFKDINDGLGHPMGDRVLRYVGEYIRIICETYGLPVRQRFYRYGGDELVVFVEPELIKQVSRSIDAMIAVELRPDEYRDLPQVTVSCGYGPDFVSADQALYRKKAARRERT
jgi:diguanylate cyclase (GGDEF)-like protein